MVHGGSLDADADGLRTTGERIATLLDASAAGGEVARQRAEDLVALVTNLYGAGLERLLDILADAGRLDQQTLDALADDELVASLLLVHGLHPHDVTTRVSRALDSVRPYLGSHGGDVELLAVDVDDVVHLRLLGSCDGCPSSSVTLQLAVEGAIESAAPEVTAIEVESAPSSAAAGRDVIPVDALRSRLGNAGESASALVGGWFPVPEAADLTSGGVAGFQVGDTALLVCRVGADLFAFRDSCGRCGSDLAGCRLERPLGQPVGAAVLTCPTCRAHFDVRRAGMSTDHVEAHLDPLPLLTRDGVLSVAVPLGAPA